MKIKTTLSLLGILFISFLTQAQTIDLTGMGVHNDPISTLYFTDLNTIDQVVVEAVYKWHESAPSGQVHFYDNDESYYVDANPVEYIRTVPVPEQNPSYFTATFTSVDENGITLDQLLNFGGMHSFIAYIYRTDNTSNIISYSSFDHVFMFRNGVDNAFDYVIPINTAENPRDIVVNVPISEMAFDTRQCVINVSDGNQNLQQILTQPNLGDALNIAPFTLQDVAPDVSEVTISIYSPFAPYGTGDSFITGAVILDVEQDEPQIPCDECEGQITELSLEYLGDEIDATVKVYSKKVEPNKLIAEFNNVNQGDILSFVGTGKHNKMGSKIRITINDDNSDYTEIHTSCSQPIYVGMTFDDLFLITAGASHEGGPLCDNPNPPPPGGGDCDECDGQITELSLEYLGDETNATVKVYKKKVKPSELIVEFNNVNQGDILSFVGTGKHNKMGSKIRITINDDNSNYTEIHTSCSQPIYVGMTYDDLFLITEGASHNGGPLCDIGNKSGQYFEPFVTTKKATMTAYPNPMKDQAVIDFEVSENGPTRIDVINIQGQMVKTIFNKYTEVGYKYSVLLDVSDMTQGIYLLRMVNNTEVLTSKISIQ